MRKAHIIAENKGNEYPNHMLFFDTETKEKIINDTTKELMLNFGIVAYHRVKKDNQNGYSIFKTFKSNNIFWDFVESRCYAHARTYLIAHNITFDFKVTNGFAILQKRGWKLQKLINVGTRNIWEFRKDKKCIVCLDNMNIFNSSLDALGESIGIKKLKMPDVSAPFIEWETYCKRDVEVMIEAWKLWHSFLSENELGNFGKTLASQAFNAYRHKFMFTPVYIHDNKEATLLERASYHGGRTEPFFIGDLPKAKYYYLDVNSMYPSVMLKNDYPTKLLSIDYNIPINRLKALLDDFCVIAEVNITTPENVFPVLKNKRLIFPIGSFSTTLTSRELEYALKNNYILSVSKASIYSKSVLFHDYISFFYTKRLEYKKDKNIAFSFICKLLLNSLYGKFGQRQDVYKKIADIEDKRTMIWTEYDYDQEENRTFRLLNGILEERIGLEEGFNSFPAIASHITADARMKLWNYMQKVGKENVLYCDTDSIFTDQKGYNKIKDKLDSETIGKLALKREESTLHIRGPKDYTFGSDKVIKGIRRDAIELSVNVFSQVRFEGLLGAWHKGRLNRQIITTQTKHLTREYKKGIITKSGRVEPFLI